MLIAFQKNSCYNEENDKEREILMKVMFICTANICRSAMAEAIMKEEVKNRRTRYRSILIRNFCRERRLCFI